MKGKFKQWWSKILQISTKQTTTSHLKPLNTKKTPRHMAFEINDNVDLLTSNKKPAQIFFHSKRLLSYAVKKVLIISRWLKKKKVYVKVMH